MRKLSVSTLVTLDGVVQDPGGFGEIAQGGWANPYFTEEAAQSAYEHLMASDYFLCGRVDVAEEIAKLKQQDGKGIEMYGSVSLMQTYDSGIAGLIYEPAR